MNNEAPWVNDCKKAVIERIEAKVKANTASLLEKDITKATAFLSNVANAIDEEFIVTVVTTEVFNAAEEYLVKHYKQPLEK